MSNDTLGYQNPSTVDKNLAAQTLTRTTTDGTAVSTVVDREEIVLGDPLQDFMTEVDPAGYLRVCDDRNRWLLEKIYIELIKLNTNLGELILGKASESQGERI